MSKPKVFEIQELDPDIIQPTTSRKNDPEGFGSKIVVAGKPGCFGLGTPVLKYDGSIVPVEDIIEGDLLMGDDSTPRTVLELCRNVDKMYRIEPKKGESYIVNEGHSLVLMSLGYHDISKGEIIEITVKDYLEKSKEWQDRWAVFRTAVDFPEKEIELDPYLLGLWLGDGTSATTEITNIDKEIISYLENYCEDNNMLFTQKKGITYRIRSVEGTKNKNAFLNSLNSLNLINNKHIPLCYKANSKEIRLQILAGLIDTDGSYDKRGNCFDIIQKSKTLADDITFVARSLGFTAALRETEKSCLYKGEKRTGTYYRITISGNIDSVPCKIFRKQANLRTCNRNNLVSRFKVELVNEDQYYGFTIDGNHRFLLGTCDVVRNTGKSTLIKSLLYAKKHIFPVGIAMSGSEDSNHAYKEIMPSSFVFNEYNEDKIKDFIKRQKIAKQHLEVPWAVCLLDDCTDDPKIFNKPLQHGMYKRGRHWKMWYILSLQYAIDVKPVIRTNVDGIFILREPILKNRETLWKNYASIIPDFALFCAIMDQITDDYTALYIHNASKTNDWKDCVYWYKAPLTPKGWKFGCKDYWDFHNDRYNPEYVDPFDF